ncbi:MAG: hypothetical protein QXS91_01150 [Candidatus Anstonellales archaeon]
MSAIVQCQPIIFPAATWIAFLVALLIVVIAKLAGKILNKTEIEAWAHVEAQSIALVLVIMIFFIGFMNILPSILTFYIVNYLPQFTFITSGCPQANMINLAQNMIYNYMNNIFLPAFGEIFNTVHAIEFFSGYSVRAVGTPGVDVKQRITAGFDILLQPMIIIRDLFPILITSMGMQLIIYDAILVIYDYIIPFALILMLFSPTRAIGREIVALGFSIVIFMPFLYILLNAAVLDIGQKTGLININQQLSSNLINAISSLALKILIITQYASIIFLLVESLVHITAVFAYASFISLLLPTFVLITSITFTKAMSEVLNVIT